MARTAPEAGLKDRVLFREEDRTIRKIAKARFILGENPIGFLAFLSAQGGNQIFRLVPPYFSDSVVGRLGATGQLGVSIELGIERVALDVADGAEGLGITPDERPMVFEPVFAKGLGREIRAAADAINEFDHNVPIDMGGTGWCLRFF